MDTKNIPALESIETPAPPNESRQDQALVQFANNIFYVDEGTMLEVPVMRLGNVDSECSADWCTNPSPYEGKKFDASKGTVTFKPGESLAKFEVQMLSDDNFDSTLEFGLTLSNPVGCELGLYLKRAGVKILDDDVFPSNKYKERLAQDPSCLSWKEGESFAMLRSWAGYTFRHTPGSKWILLADQIDNLIALSEIVVMRFLVNEVQRSNQFGATLQESENLIIIFGLLVTVPFAITHWFKYRRTKWKVTGGARKVLQENLLRKYLNQSEARRFASRSDFLEAFGPDVKDLISNGYSKFFATAKAMGQVVLALAFTLYMAINAYLNMNMYWVFFGLLPFVVLPIILFIFVKCRDFTCHHARETEHKAEEAMLQKVHHALKCYRMVADYFARGLVVQDVCDDVAKVNKAIANLAGINNNNNAFVMWVNEILQFIWIIVGGRDVLRGFSDPNHMALGTFLAVLSLFKSNGAQFHSLFNIYMTMETTYPALWRVVTFMNLPSDLRRRKETAAFRITKSQELLKIARQAAGRSTAFPMDTVPIDMQGVKFKYADSPEPQVKDFTATIRQGKAIAFTGRSGSGKATTMKIIGQVLAHDEGEVIVPSHLRVLHIDAEVQLWPGTMAENVYFGACASVGMPTDAYQNLDKATFDRGVRIAKRLGFSHQMLRALEDLKSQVNVDEHPLSAGERKLIHVARALVYNPEVMVIHHPTNSLDDERSIVVMKCLRAFVDERGLEMDKATMHLRRPRTLFFSSVQARDLTYADAAVFAGAVDV